MGRLLLETILAKAVPPAWQFLDIVTVPDEPEYAAPCRVYGSVQRQNGHSLCEMLLARWHFGSVEVLEMSITCPQGWLG